MVPKAQKCTAALDSWSSVRQRS